MTWCSMVSVSPPARRAMTGRSRGHRLDGHEPERLGPGAQHDRGDGAGVERVPLGRAELAEERDDALVDGRLYDLGEVLLLQAVVDLGRHAQRHVRPSRQLDGVGDALLGRDPSHEGEV